METDKQLIPHTARAPCCQRFWIAIFRTLAVLVYMYCTFILLQLALFNLILLGIFVVYLRKLYVNLHNYELRIDY